MAIWLFEANKQKCGPPTGTLKLFFKVLITFKFISSMVAEYEEFNVVIWICCQYFLRLLHLQLVPNVDIPQDKIIKGHRSQKLFFIIEFTKSTDIF